MKQLSLIIVVFFTLSGFSQNTIVLEGRVTADSLEGSAINIINLSREIGTTNSESGRFKIEVQENDTLLFSSVQYELVHVVITANILKNEFLEIALQENLNELKEVTISNSSLTGNLKHDASYIPTIDQKDFGFPISTQKRLTPIERQLNSAHGGSVITILNHLNGTIKMLKKAKENEDLTILVEKSLAEFPTDFFIDTLGLLEEEIKPFLYFCVRDPEFEILLKNSDKLKLLEYYQTRVKDFVLNSKG